jgi:hypothetical protein
VAARCNSDAVPAALYIKDFLPHEEHSVLIEGTIIMKKMLAATSAALIASALLSPGALAGKLRGKVTTTGDSGMACMDDSNSIVANADGEWSTTKPMKAGNPCSAGHKKGLNAVNVSNGKGIQENGIK